MHSHTVIPPKYVSFVVETLKKMSAGVKACVRRQGGADRGESGQKGTFVSTVGIDEDIIRRYVAMQANIADKRSLNFRKDTT
ncbi:MAG: hypothetical protein R3B74_01935 [Nitrospirales bacterium]|nr:hypothetical protein [Nitrospirales bacterium]